MNPLLPPQDAPPRGLASLGWSLSLLITTAALLAVALPAGAAERSGRLTVTVEVEREASTRNGSDHARQTSRSFVQFSTTLQSDGTLSSINPIDPTEATRQMAKAAQVQQRVQQVQREQAQRPATHAGPSQAEMMARVQQMQALCGADRDCLAREAMKFSAANSGLDASGQGRLQAYGVAYRQCEARHADGPARRSCIDNARRQAGGQPDATDHDDEAPPRFQSFIGDSGCQAEARVKLNERNEGAYADVQGMVPFVTTRQADERPASPLLCAGQHLVLDTQTGELWSHGGIGIGEVRGVTVSTRGGRSERHEGTMDIGWYEAAPWISEQLRRMPRQGEKQHLVPLANGSGQVKVKLQWRFEAR